MHMRVRKIIKWTVILFALTALIFICLEYIWRATNCKEGGWDSHNALIHANDKLKGTLESAPHLFKKDLFFNDFTVSSKLFQSPDWIFTFSSKSCFIDIIIDQCGASDVGGISEGCFRDNKGQLPIN